MNKQGRTGADQAGHEDPHEGTMSYNRRTVVQAGLVTAIVGGGGLITPVDVGGAQSTPATPPSVDGKIPGGPGVPDAYREPPPVFQAVETIPGNGSDVSLFTLNYQPPVPSRDDNRYWQELEKRLGVKRLDVTFAPPQGYAEKLAAVTAGGDLPDLTYVHLGQAPAQYQAIFQGAWLDLTPYLTGDALAEYPNLAAFEPRLWQDVAIEGKIYGVPKPRFDIGGSIAFRQDWGETFGMPQPADADEFFWLLQQFTQQDPDGNGKTDTWGIGSKASDTFCNRSLGTMFRVPHGWRVDVDGGLTNNLETDEFKATVTYQRKLFEAGLFHPASATAAPAEATDNFIAGRYGAYQEALTSIVDLRARTTAVNATASPTALILPGFDGGNAVSYPGTGYFGMVAIPARLGEDEERVKELLRILNYYAAPFGSEEWTFLNYGIEGVHHTVEAENQRLLTELGEKEIGALKYPMNGPVVFYHPDAPGEAEYVQGLVRDLVARAVENPVQALYSPTDAEAGGTLAQLWKDRVNAIVQGREPLDALDRLVQDWRQRGGDQIRTEYEEALASA